MASRTDNSGDTGEQIRNHKLACSVINFHNTADAVFDNDSLERLQAFTVDRSIANRDHYLAARNQTDPADAARPGEKAADAGDLVGLLIARYETTDPAFDEKDWELLERWFGKGMPEGESVSR